MKYRLLRPKSDAYTFYVRQTTRTWFRSQYNRSAQPRIAVFLCVSPLCALFNGRTGWWESLTARRFLRLPVCESRYLLVCPPHFAVAGRPSQTEGARHAC